MNQTEIGKHIAALRKRKGLTQEALAEKLHISSKSISRWETGRNMPDYAVLGQLADELDVDVPSLLGAPQPVNHLSPRSLIKSEIHAFLSPALSKKSKVYFAGLTIAYLILRYSFVWTAAHFMWLLAAILIPNALFGFAGYFLLRKKAFIAPITAYASSLVFLSCY